MFPRAQAAVLGLFLTEKGEKRYTTIDYREKWKHRKVWDFPGGPVGKTLPSQCKGPRFDPRSGNYILHATTKSSHAATKILHAATKTRHSLN